MFDLRAMLAAKADEQLQAIADSYQLDTAGLNRQQVTDALIEAIRVRLRQLSGEVNHEASQAD